MTNLLLELFKFVDASGDATVDGFIDTTEGIIEGMTKGSAEGTLGDTVGGVINDAGDTSEGNVESAPTMAAGVSALNSRTSG